MFPEWHLTVIREFRDLLGWFLARRWFKLVVHWIFHFRFHLQAIFPSHRKIQGPNIPGISILAYFLTRKDRRRAMSILPDIFCRDIRPVELVLRNQALGNLLVWILIRMLLNRVNEEAPD